MSSIPFRSKPRRSMRNLRTKTKLRYFMLADPSTTKKMSRGFRPHGTSGGNRAKIRKDYFLVYNVFTRNKSLSPHMLTYYWSLFTLSQTTQTNKQKFTCKWCEWTITYNVLLYNYQSSFDTSIGREPWSVRGRTHGWHHFSDKPITVTSELSAANDVLFCVHHDHVK